MEPTPRVSREVSTSGTEQEIRFSRNSDEDCPSPVRNGQESPGKRQRLRRLEGLETGTQLGHLNAKTHSV